MCALLKWLYSYETTASSPVINSQHAAPTNSNCRLPPTVISNTGAPTVYAHPHDLSMHRMLDGGAPSVIRWIEMFFLLHFGIYGFTNWFI